MKAAASRTSKRHRRCRHPGCAELATNVDQIRNIRDGLSDLRLVRIQLAALCCKPSRPRPLPRRKASCGQGGMGFINSRGFGRCTACQARAQLRRIPKTFFDPSHRFIQEIKSENRSSLGMGIVCCFLSARSPKLGLDSQSLRVRFGKGTAPGAQCVIQASSASWLAWSNLKAPGTPAAGNPHRRSHWWSMHSRIVADGTSSSVKGFG